MALVSRLWGVAVLFVWSVLAAGLAGEAVGMLPPAVQMEDAPDGTRVYAAIDGRTLYRLSTDRKGPSACSAGCIGVWRPYMAMPGAEPMGDFLLVEHPVGGWQWAYQGYPLYTYAGDTTPGETNGAGPGSWGTGLPLIASAPVRDMPPPPASAQMPRQHSESYGTLDALRPAPDATPGERIVDGVQMIVIGALSFGLGYLILDHLPDCRNESTQPAADGGPSPYEECEEEWTNNFEAGGSLSVIGIVLVGMGVYEGVGGVVEATQDALSEQQVPPSRGWLGHGQVGAQTWPGTLGGGNGPSVGVGFRIGF